MIRPVDGEPITYGAIAENPWLLGDVFYYSGSVQISSYDRVVDVESSRRSRLPQLAARFGPNGPAVLASPGFAESVSPFHPPGFGWLIGQNSVFAWCLSEHHQLQIHKF